MKVNPDVFYDRLLSELKNLVPGFSFDLEEGVYPVLGLFGNYVLAHLDNEDIMKLCFDFIETAFVHGGERTDNAICLTVFEQLYLDDKGLTIARIYLKKKSRVEFESYLIGFKAVHSKPID